MKRSRIWNERKPSSSHTSWPIEVCRLCGKIFYIQIDMATKSRKFWSESSSRAEEMKSSNLSCDSGKWICVAESHRECAINKLLSDPSTYVHKRKVNREKWKEREISWNFLFIKPLSSASSAKSRNMSTGAPHAYHSAKYHVTKLTGMMM